MIGTQIGDLKLIRQLDKGGMGTVYLAEHQLLNDLRAVKLLHPELAHKEELVTRFLNEGRAAVKLKHPNLALVHDIGRLPDNGPYYMVMEFLDGMSLARFLALHPGPQSIYTTLEILSYVLGCAQYMHDHDVIHRDLKPRNLFLVSRPDDPRFVKVLDLGIARISDEIAEGPDTRTGVMMGTPVYMAPEQFAGNKVTAQSDLFAVGLIAYEMLTGGWFPWQEDHETREMYTQLREGVLYHRQRTARPTDPRRRCPHISEGVAEILLRTLDADPWKRPESARELACLLAEQAPGDEAHENGLQIIEKRAKDLLKGTTDSPTVRALSSPVHERGKLRYQLGAMLGAGGMAEVFEGRLLGVEGFERRVAIKRVLPWFSERPDFVEMFAMEARIASRLNHTNVASVLDFDRDEDGRLYLVMEYVHGRDLASLLHAGPLSPSLIIYIVSEMLRGLGYAHAPEPGREGVVHRDISPQNLLLSYEGAVKVVDFGLARVRSESGNARSEHVRGKPSYMSPEQCNGYALDARSDLFAVGVMLHEMLTHQPLFPGDAVYEILARILFQTVPLPSSMRSGVPADLERITMKLLARKADDRYPTAEAVIEELLQCEDAPRDGRGELVHILAQRFPDNALRTRFSTSGTGPSSKPVSSRSRPAEQMAAPVPARATVTGPDPVSTLQGAASQTAPQLAARSRLIGLGLGAAALLVALVALFATTHRSSRAPTAQPSTPVVTASASSGIPPVAPQSPPEVASQPSREVTAAPPPAVTTAPPVTTPKASVPSNAPASATAGTAPPPVGEPGSPRSPTPAVPPSKELGELAIFVRPWASVTLNGKASGTTPYRQSVPAGRYRIRLYNDDLGLSYVTTVTVEPHKTTTIDRKW